MNGCYYIVQRYANGKATDIDGFYCCNTTQALGNAAERHPMRPREKLIARPALTRNEEMLACRLYCKRTDEINEFYDLMEVDCPPAKFERDAQ